MASDGLAPAEQSRELSWTNGSNYIILYGPCQPPASVALRLLQGRHSKGRALAM